MDFEGPISEAHDYRDVSYNDHPLMQCRFCDDMQYNSKGAKCPKAVKARTQERESAIAREKYEYAEMLRQKARFEYLHAKYAGIVTI